MKNECKEKAICPNCKTDLSNDLDFKNIERLRKSRLCFCPKCSGAYDGVEFVKTVDVEEPAEEVDVSSIKVCDEVQHKNGFWYKVVRLVGVSGLQIICEHYVAMRIDDIIAHRPAKKEEPTCPKCGGEADNGHDREDPPNAYTCSKCEEPTNEPENRKPKMGDHVWGLNAHEGWSKETYTYVGDDKITCHFVYDGNSVKTFENVSLSNPHEKAQARVEEFKESLLNIKHLAELNFMHCDTCETILNFINLHHRDLEKGQG